MLPRDPLAHELRGFGYRTINPPSMLVDVGSLYFVSEDGRDFQVICRADPADVAAVVQKSPSLRIQADFNQHGSFATEISVDFSALFHGGVANNYDQKVHYTLSDTTIAEIPLASNKQIETKLMKDPACSEAVLEQLRAGAYVCQPQQILLATAEYKLDRDSQNKLEVDANIAPDQLKEALKIAIKTQSDQTVVEKEGRLYSGAALNYGVEVNPTCITPPHASFARHLPWTRWDRVVDFVFYRVIEPWLPPTPDLPPAVLQAASAVTR